MRFENPAEATGGAVAMRLAAISICKGCLVVLWGPWGCLGASLTVLWCPQGVLG